MRRLNNFVIFILVVSAKSSRSGKRNELNGNHECLRLCDDGPSSRKLCRYEFFVSELPIRNSIYNESDAANEATGCEERTSPGILLGINGKSPGPGIEICIGDTIEILVHNRLGSQELSLHWHGLRQKGSPHMDGVPMVTQCAILPHGGFRYKIKPEAVGTFFYHAHSVSQQGDGVYGSLTVRGPRDDPTLERILLLSSRTPTPLSRHSHLYPPTPSELLVNGKGNGTVLKVSHGERYLLRLINANAYNCPILLSISEHAFRVLATDGNLVQSMTAAHAVLFPGERLDVVVETIQPPGKYLVNVIGLQDCLNLRQEALLLYDGVDTNTPLIKDRQELEIDKQAILDSGYNCQEISKSFVCALDLKSSTEIVAKNKADEVIFIPFDVNVFTSFTDEMTDNRYNFFGCPFYPSYLSTESKEIKIAQINDMSFKYPSSPILSQPENVSEESVCSLERQSSLCADTPLFCECVQIIEVPPKKTIEIILIDEGFGGNTSHTFHMHGYNASIMGRESFERPITRQEIVSLDHAGKLFRNFMNPPQKDSFVVPNKGYVILRFYTDNLGYWLWEARSTSISPGTFGPGLQFLIKVGNRENLLPVPINFPTCGNNKRPDMVFETN